MRELPVIQTSCSLSASDRKKRAEEIATLAPDVLSHARVGDALKLRFARDASVQRRIEVLRSKESECCPFLEFNLTVSDEAIELELTAPTDSAETLDRFERLLSR